MRILVYTKNGKPSKNAWDASWIGLYKFIENEELIIF